MRDDTADALAELVFKALIFLLFGVFILAFKYPKIMIPLLVIGGAAILMLASQ